LDELYAEGTTVELRNGIRQAYSETLHDHEVTINLKDFEKPYFIARGGGGAGQVRADSRGGCSHVSRTTTGLSFTIRANRVIRTI
jgi:hypothetical protein